LVFDILVIMIQFINMTPKKRTTKQNDQMKRSPGSFIVSVAGVFLSKIAWDFYWFFKKRGMKENENGNKGG